MDTMTTTITELENLRGLAEAATPGQWRFVNHNNETELSQASDDFSVVSADGKVIVSEPSCSRERLPEVCNGAYIAAANPANIISLLDELEAAQAEVATLKTTYNQLFDAIQGEQEEGAKLRARLAELVALHRMEEKWKHDVKSGPYPGRMTPTEGTALYNEFTTKFPGAWDAAIAAAGASPVQPADLNVKVNLCEQCGKVLPNTGTYGHSCDAVYRPVQPANSPCKGKNCGSTDHRLHSAECFAEHAAVVGRAGQARELSYSEVEWVARGLIGEGKWSNQNFARAIIAAINAKGDGK